MVCKTHYFINERIKNLTFTTDETKTENPITCTITLDNGTIITGDGNDNDTSHDAAYAKAFQLFTDGDESTAPLPKVENEPLNPTHPDYHLTVGAKGVGIPTEQSNPEPKPFPKKVMKIAETGFLQGATPGPKETKIGEDATVNDNPTV